MTEESIISPAEKFVGAYWDWLRRDRPTEPSPLDYGLTIQHGDSMARMVHQTFEQQQKSKTERIAQQRAQQRIQR